VSKTTRRERERREQQAAAAKPAAAATLVDGKRTRKLTPEEVLAVQVIRLENEADALRIECSKYLDQVMALKRDLLQAQCNAAGRSRGAMLLRYKLPKQWTAVEDGDDVTIEWTEASAEPTKLPVAQPPAAPVAQADEEELEDDEEELEEDELPGNGATPVAGAAPGTPTHVR
jgi:hypothetical protein